MTSVVEVAALAPGVRRSGGAAFDERAGAAGGQLAHVLDGVATKAKTMSDYGQSLKKLFGEAAPECVADASLYRFLNKIGNDGPSLSDLYSARLLRRRKSRAS